MRLCHENEKIGTDVNLKLIVKLFQEIARKVQTLAYTFIVSFVFFFFFFLYKLLFSATWDRRTSKLRLNLVQNKGKVEALETKILFHQGKEKPFLKGLGKPPVLDSANPSFFQLVEL